LNKNLYIKKFTIRKIINNTSEPLDITPPINNFNRYNLLKYMFCLNEKSVEMFIDNDNIISDCGDLLLFPNDVSYKIKIPILETVYIIYGEVAYNETN
jgi:hypothetical protein